MEVTKEMHDKELQPQYGQFRTIIAVNSKKLGLKVMDSLVRLAKGQKVKEAINETHFVSSQHTKDHKIRTREFRPEGTENETLPAMVYFHGGGYMMGIPEMANTFYADILKKRKVAIFSPDYRVSQKDPFPAVNDCYDVLLWMKDKAKELKIDPNNIIVAGHSGGGGMAAAITLKARDTGDVKPIFQMPLYPMLDHRMITESSKMQGSTMWDANINARAWKLYHRDIQGEIPAYAAPVLNEDYINFPPTISFVGDLEPFYDENVAYIEALKSADIPVLNININLPGETFTGSQVDFHDKTTSKTVQTIFEPGKAIIHRGNVPHATHPITSGQRSNLVVWLYGEGMQIPRGGANSYGDFGNSASKVNTTKNITARQRWSVPDSPKDTFAPF